MTTLASLKTGQWLSVCSIAPSGTLQARRLSDGTINFYWRFKVAGTSQRVPIGPYDAKLPPRSVKPSMGRYSVAAAEAAAKALAVKHVEHLAEGGLPAVRAAEAQQQAQARAAKQEAGKWTLERLCDEYVLYLEALGRDSYRQARSVFKCHVKAAWPALAAKPAAAVTDEDVADMMRAANDKGHTRAGNKVRSYLHAAYELARTARTTAATPVIFKGFGVRINPAHDTKPDRSVGGVDKNALKAPELRAFWRAAKAAPGKQAAIVRFFLLVGGQRIAQVCRLKTADIHWDEGYVAIYDGKGRPGKPPRRHVLPLTKAAAKALKECGPVGTYALSTDGGKTPIAPTTLSRDWAKPIAAAAGIKGFTAKRIRSGMETALAAMGYDKDRRGRLLSHGIAGVQDTHYDDHDYLPEKRAMLEAVFKLLDAPTPAKPARVADIADARQRRAA